MKAYLIAWIILGDLCGAIFLGSRDAWPFSIAIEEREASRGHSQIEYSFF